ncbi:transient receptor potential cation channel subfamily M member-like 2 [Symsagittifera roscoffensis]|uniref:transient receptor potential cation channel subfamily M member-like 2 n=1 Tax=Symsagittifera roscoffensis TaxID=84072 RepID=UPI00307B4F0B
MKLKALLCCEWSYIQIISSVFGCIAYVIRNLSITVLTIHAGYGTSMYAISGFFIWIRLLSFYRCSRKLGPLWIMLRKMMHEALGFMLIFSTISIAAGISMQSLMDVYGYEDQYSSGIQWLWLRPFFMFTGENFLKTVGSTERDDNFIVCYSIVCIVFFLLGNALMLNLLLAIFSEIFKNVFMHSDREFKTEFLMLIREYSSKTTLPVPLMLFELSYSILVNLTSRINSSDILSNQKRSSNFRLEEVQIMQYFENHSSSKMLSRIEKRLDNDAIVSYALRSIDEQQGRLADLKIVFEAVERQLDNRFVSLEKTSMIAESYD